jgi:microcystin degradation protein MlrC
VLRRVKVHAAGEAGAPERGIDVVLTARRGQGYSPSIFSGVGIDPERKRILVVKSTQHFHAGFAPISKQVLYAGDLGALPGEMTAIPLRRADTARLWPFVEDPFARSRRRGEKELR